MPSETVEFGIQLSIWLISGALFFGNVINTESQIVQLTTFLQADRLTNYIAANVNLVGFLEVQICITLPGEINGQQYHILVNDDLIIIQIANQAVAHKTKFLVENNVLHPGKTYCLSLKSSKVMFYEE